MRLDGRATFILIVLFTVILFPVVFFTSGPVRITLSFFYLMLFPGYALLIALFPNRGDLSIVEQIALSFGLSIALMVVAGLVLNFTPWGISLVPIIICLAIFVLIASAVGLVRQLNTAGTVSPNVQFRYDWEKLKKNSPASKLVIISLMLTTVIMVGFIIYFSQTQIDVKKPTEFYILNSMGQVTDYPSHIKLGNSIDLRVVVVSHEPDITTYLVNIVSGDRVLRQIDGIQLMQGAKWEQSINITPDLVGNNQKIEFYLYKKDAVEPYFRDPLYIYVDISE